ncbi:MAG: hypothetical protein WA208_01590 [Thermoanaerobaculia bacterium]
MFGGIAPIEITGVLFSVAVLVALVTWLAARILRRLGFPAWLAFLVAVPLLNIGLLYFVAFTPPPTDPSSRDRS